ncbi:MAG: ABC transporter permease [Zavarzinella sp.]
MSAENNDTSPAPNLAGQALAGMLPSRLTRGVPIAAWLWGPNSFLRTILSLLPYTIILCISLLPLSWLVITLPFFFSQENILKDVQSKPANWLQGLPRRLFAFFSGLALLFALLALTVQLVTMVGLQNDIFGKIATDLLPEGIVKRLPKALISGWPFVLLIMYLTDLVLLYFIGRVPLQYNLRNLKVRWISTIMTASAFAVVVILVSIMMAFIDSVNNLTKQSGIPGNVFVLSEGSTDELFSSLGYGSMDKIELEKATEDVRYDPITPLKNPITPKKAMINGKMMPLVSKETYFVVNQENPRDKSKRRFVQLRGIDNGLIAGQVHNIELIDGEWFDDKGSIQLPDGSTAVPCVIGEGAAVAYAEDFGVDQFGVNDRFQLGDLNMVVVGVMKSEGSTFGSETWANQKRVGKQFGKEASTTVVIRVSDDTQEGAEIFAAHLTRNFTDPKLRAVSEIRYYEDLGKSNAQLIYMVNILGIIMGLGGVIGIMLVMFATISQRTKDIGVMRVIGFKRVQIFVSFLLESLCIALVGAVMAIILLKLGEAAFNILGDGIPISSNISSGQGGKSVVTKLAFGRDVLVIGLLSALVMGRLGGIIPSISGMRKPILDALR